MPAAQSDQSCSGQGGPFVTVMPRSRQDDGQFRKWMQDYAPAWGSSRIGRSSGATL